MEEIETMSPESTQEKLLREKLNESERIVEGLQQDLASIDNELEKLAGRNHQYEILSRVCNSLDELGDLDAKHLFWGSADQQEVSQRLEHARREIDLFHDEIREVESRRDGIVEKIEDNNVQLDYLHYDLLDAIEEEESRRDEWLVEREDTELPKRALIMPWARGFEEDDRFNRSLLGSVAASLLLLLIVNLVDIPIFERNEVVPVPERVASLVRKEVKPPPPVEEELLAAEEIPEPEPEPEVEPEPLEDHPQDLTPDVTDKAVVADVQQPDTKEQVKSKGILAFRDSFANRASARPSAQLGSQARVSNGGEEAIGRPTRSMVSSNAPGSSGGINLASISRDVGGGGGSGIDGVQVSRVASSIGGAEGPSRPLSAGASAGRTDEEIQIVFDRYKAALYRLYNKELRKDPTLRGQLIIRLTIEPDGTVSLCQLHGTDMDAPALAQQVVARVGNFDFGAKDGIVAMTIIYPIDFLPAA